MRLRNWLLLSSSLVVLTVAPYAASAQEVDDAFREGCIAEGFTSVDECLAARGAAAAETPPAEETPAEEPAAEEAAPVEAAPEEQPIPEEVAPEATESAPEEPVIEEPAASEEEAAPEVTQEAAPEPAEQATEAAPAEEPAAEAPANEATTSTESEPVVTEEPATQEAAPETPAEQPTAPEATTTQDTAPVTEEATPAPEETAPTTEQAPATEQAAPTIEQAPVTEQAAPTTEEAAPVTDQNVTGTPPVVDDAFRESCIAEGFTNLEDCIDARGGAEATQPTETAPTETPATDTTTPPTETPATDATAPAEQQVNAAGQPTEVIEELPPGVTQEAVAPVLDSAKDVETQAVIQQDGGTVADPNTAVPPTTAQEQTAPTEPAAPPPESDFAAQGRIQFATEEVQSVTAEQGQVVDVAPQIEQPQNVTIINQITNTTVNNTTVNNNAPNADNSVNINVGFIYEVDNQLFISTPLQDRDRISRDDDVIYYEELSNGRVRETVERPDGTRIVTVRNRYGDVLRRSRIEPDDREYVLAYFDDSQFEEDDDEYFFRDPGDDLPPLRLNISVDEYVLDSQDADEEEISVFFSQPPVEEVQRLYSIEEVKRSARVRDTVRRLEVGNLTFDTGAATISRDQVSNLSAVASAMQDLLEQNPAETFLIEGHTDAVGTDVSNLELSDRRANTVAQILTDFYDIPPENLATQGYGERYLKIRTEEGERQNRRVTLRRITPLVTPVASN